MLTVSEVREGFASFDSRGSGDIRIDEDALEEFDNWLAGHDSEIRYAAIREALAALIPEGAYADFSRAEATGDKIGQAYHEGLHDAWAAVNDLLPKETDGREF